MYKQSFAIRSNTAPDHQLLSTRCSLTRLFPSCNLYVASAMFRMQTRRFPNIFDFFLHFLICNFWLQFLTPSPQLLFFRSSGVILGIWADVLAGKAYLRSIFRMLEVEISIFMPFLFGWKLKMSLFLFKPLLFRTFWTLFLVYQEFFVFEVSVIFESINNSGYGRFRCWKLRLVWGNCLFESN